MLTKVVGNILVLSDNGQPLAAEPGFHHDAPQGGGTGLMSIRHVSDHLSERLEQQPKNVPGLAQGSAWVSGVVENVTVAPYPRIVTGFTTVS